jgi:hypothetical protein
MDTVEIVRALDSEIARLQQARTILVSVESHRGPGRPVGRVSAKKTPAPVAAVTQPVRKLSSASRTRIAEAQKLRWAKVRLAAKRAAAAQKPLVATVPPKANAKKAASTKVAAKKAATKKSVANKDSSGPTASAA